jgi:hypothetical protein
VAISRRGIESASKSDLSQAHTSTGPPAMPAVVRSTSPCSERSSSASIDPTRFGAGAVGCAS